MCAGAGARLAGIWEPAGVALRRKEAIHAAFGKTARAYAAQAFAATARLLDEYAGRWAAMYRDACEATHVRGEQSAEVLDLRMACLQERMTSLRAVTDVLSHADPTVVES